MTPLICLASYCFNFITMIDTTAEEYIRTTKLEYCLWWYGLPCTDCWWIVTQAIRQQWYRGPRISSYFQDPRCLIKPSSMKPWDILINRNEWQRHVALITSTYNYKSRDFWIIDYVQEHKKATYRLHSIYWDMHVFSTKCLILNSEHVPK